MNVVVRIVADYLRRTFGVWLLAWFLHPMQASALFARGEDRVPIVGAVIAAIAFFATFEPRHSVMQTLPLSRRQMALARWWTSIGWPALFSALCILVGWFANGQWDFPRPAAADLWFQLLVCASLLVVLSLLPMPVLMEKGRGMAKFVLVWGVLVIASLRGLPAWLLPPATWFVFVAAALGIAGVSYARAEQRGEVLAFPRKLLDRLRWKSQSGAESLRPSTLRGWSVLLVQMARTIGILTVVGIIGVSLLRALLPAFDRGQGYITALGVGYISVIGVASSFLVRRWLGAIRVLQILPIADSSLALLTWISLMAPSLIACAVASAVHAVVPALGVHIPYYMYPLFALVPIFAVPAPHQASAAVPSAIEQWSPLLQLALWPLWAGAFTSLAMARLMLSWFNTLAILATIVFAVIGYLLVFLRIRSGTGLERMMGPLAAR